jgi:hypothetical protein
MINGYQSGNLVVEKVNMYYSRYIFSATASVPLVVICILLIMTTTSETLAVAL